MRRPNAHGRRTSMQGVAVRAGVVALGCVLAVSTAGAAGRASADASFVRGAEIPIGPPPTDVALADFDGDGSPDVAAASCGDARNAVTIVLNDGNGAFDPAPGSPIMPAVHPCSLASGDLNGDAKPDLAVADRGSQNVAILLGDGAGRFTAAPGSPVKVDGDPVGVTAGDLTGDGNLDLVVPVADPGTGRVTGISILLGDGSGRFAPAAGSPISILAGHSLSVAVADLNRDGRRDLVLGDQALNKVSLLLGHADGRFGPASTVDSIRGPGAVAVRDLDGDGKLDLAVLGRQGVTILLADGAGGFRAAPGSPVAVQGGDLATADFNGDGNPDLGVANAEAAAVSVLLGDGGGRFRQAQFSPFSAFSPGRIAVADFDRNGMPDIVALSDAVPWWPAGPRGNVILLQTESTPQVRPGRPGAASGDAVFRTRREITALAADGNRAVVCAGGLPGVWTAPGRRFVVFKVASSGGCYGTVAVGGGRAAWTEDSCGNNSCDTAVVVAKLSGGRRREIDDEENDCGAGDCYLSGVWVGQLFGAGPLLAWNDWTVECKGGCTPEDPTLRIKAQALRRYFGGRTRTVRHDAGARPLRSVGGGRMVLEGGGHILVLDPRGRRVASVPADEATTVALTRERLGVAGRVALRLYELPRGKLRKSLPLGRSAALELSGMTSRMALLRGRHALVLARLRDGKLISFPLQAAAAKGFVDASLTPAGLFYGYNAPRAAAKGRIVFEPTRKLLARF